MQRERQSLPVGQEKSLPAGQERKAPAERSLPAGQERKAPAGQEPSSRRGAFQYWGRLTICIVSVSCSPLHNSLFGNICALNVWLELFLAFD